VAGGHQAPAQDELRVRSHGGNELEVEVVPATGRPQFADTPAYRAQLSQWRELADQIRRGLVNRNTPGIQERINEATSGLQSLTRARPRRNRPAMENNSRTGRHDTYTYGREGWWTAENQPAANQRPATIPGSNFAVPHSTLNLYQSVDLFAPPPPRLTVRDYVIIVDLHVVIYCEQLQELFNETVAARRSGCLVPKGKLFTLSMELSRVTQLRAILDEEFTEMRQIDREASRRRTTQRRGNRQGRGMPSNEGSTDEERLLDTVVDDESSSYESDEPEGWANLEFVFDGEYPQEVCFHIGSQELTFPIEEVEAWMMDQRRRERSRARTARRPTLSSHLVTGVETQLAHPENRRVMHTLAMSIPDRSIWPNYGTISHQDGDDNDDEDYREEHEDSEQFIEQGENNMPDTEYEEEDDGEDTEDDLDHEGWAERAQRDSQGAEETAMGAGGDIRNLGANAQAPVIDLTGSPSPTESQIRSQTTSDESNPTTLTSSEQEEYREPDAPHPVQGWTSNHSLFMFSCRGSIFDVTRQLQHAFGFQPSLSPHTVGERLSREYATVHRDFIMAFLPGEEAINFRAAAREFVHRENLADDDIYHGTQNIIEANVGREDYAQPPLPGLAPSYWDRTLDICLLQDLNRGRFNPLTFCRRHRETLGGTPLTEELRGFLGIRLAQVRYLGITEMELSAAREPGGWGSSD